MQQSPFRPAAGFHRRLTGLILALWFGLTLFLCTQAERAPGPSADSGEVLPGQVTVMASSVTTGDIHSLTVTVSGPYIDPDLVFDLVQTGSTWGGLLSGIPAGQNNRTFTAHAFDAGGELIYQGEAAGITIDPNTTPMVIINLLEVGPAGPIVVGHGPVVDYIGASANGVAPGGTVSLTASAQDPDPGDELSFTWSSTGGSFTGQSDTANISSTTWTAPMVAGPYTLHMVVEDSSGLQSGISLEVDVQSHYATGAAILNLTFTNLPVISTMTATPAQLTPSQLSTQLNVELAPGHPNPVSYEWSKSGCGPGSFGDSNAATSSLKSPVYTANPGAVNQSATCTFTVTITDAVSGGSISQQLVIARGPNPLNWAPVIDGAYQSTAEVVGGGDVVLQIFAHDPEGAGLVYSFQGETSTGFVGSFGVATPISGGEAITWTAPSCSDEAVLLRVNVTDPQGLSTSHNFVPVIVDVPCTPLVDTWEEFNAQVSHPTAPDIRDIDIFFNGLGLAWDPTNKLVLKTDDFGSTWTTVYTVPPGYTISDVSINGLTNTILVGQGGDGYPIIITTTDIGDSWTSISLAGVVPLGSQLLAVHAHSDYSRAVGTSGLVLSSDDLGQTWTVLPGPTTEDLVDIVGWSTNSVAVSADTLFYSQTHNGAPWQTFSLVTQVENPRLFFNGGLFIFGTNGQIKKFNFFNATPVVYSGPESFYGMYFDTLNGIAFGAGGATVVTGDGGDTWSPGPNSGLELYATDQISGQNLVGAAGDQLATSSDGGATWSAFSPSVEIPQAFIPADLAFVDGDNGFVAGTILSENTHHLYRTSDGGETWSLVSNLSPALGRMHFFSSQNGVAITSGPSGSILATGDGGLTWSEVQATSQTLTGLQFTSGAGYAVGSGGLILASYDNGLSWAPESVPTTEDLTSVYIRNSTGSLAVAVGNNGTIVTKTAPGNVWNLVASPTTANFINIGFAGPQRGFATALDGQIPAIYETTDGGATWTPYTQVPVGTLGLGFVNSVTGYAIAIDFGAQTTTFYKTIDNGANWNVVHGTDSLMLQASSIVNRLFFAGQTSTGFRTVRLTSQ